MKPRLVVTVGANYHLPLTLRQPMISVRDIQFYVPVHIIAGQVELQLQN